MSKIISEQQLSDFREINTRTIPAGAGRSETVRLTPYLWDMVEHLETFATYPLEELIAFADEEVRLQGLSFQEAFRMIVTYLSNEMRDELQESVTRSFDSSLGQIELTLDQMSWRMAEAVVRSEPTSWTFLLNTAIVKADDSTAPAIEASLRSLIDSYYQEDVTAEPTHS